MLKLGHKEKRRDAALLRTFVAGKARNSCTPQARCL